MSQYIIPLPHNDPRLFSHVSQAFSLVDLGKRLLDAAKNGDVDEVKSLMNNGAPFTTDWLGISPLHFAAMNGHLTSCEALLRAGISRDARTKVDRTPLHLAAQEGHADIVELLLRNGADLSAKDMLHMTALHWAAERGHTPVVQMLMKFGADAHLQNKFEMTPIDIAESKGHLDAREAMLNAHNDILSSVGRMAATNGDLVNANAYILTEEETLVPAAPPADEVIVTATTVDEPRNSNDCDNSSKKEEINQFELCNPNINKSEGLTEFQKSTLNHLDFNLQNEDSSKPTRNVPEDEGSTTASTNEDSGSGITITDEENNSRVIMIVETPDGEMLYVRKQTNGNGSNSLIILTSSGERVHNPALMAQVVDAMVNMSDQDALESIGSDENHSENGNNSPSISQSATSVHSRNDHMISRSTGFRSNPSKALTNSSTVALSTPESIAHDDADNENTDSLVSQLATFVNYPEPHQNSICVEGVGSGISTHELIMWCLYNGIFIRGYADESTFLAEFIYQDEPYTLGASYDSQSGSISFYHLGSDEK